MFGAKDVCYCLLSSEVKEARKESCRNANTLIVRIVEHKFRAD